MLETMELLMGWVVIRLADDTLYVGREFKTRVPDSVERWPPTATIEDVELQLPSMNVPLEADTDWIIEQHGLGPASYFLIRHYASRLPDVTTTCPNSGCYGSLAYIAAPDKKVLSTLCRQGKCVAPDILNGGYDSTCSCAEQVSQVQPVTAGLTWCVFRLYDATKAEYSLYVCQGSTTSVPGYQKRYPLAGGLQLTEIEDYLPNMGVPAAQDNSWIIVQRGTGLSTRLWIRKSFFTASDVTLICPPNPPPLPPAPTNVYANVAYISTNHALSRMFLNNSCV